MADDPETFLAEANVGILATADQSGRPHAAPIWYLYEGGEIIISTGPESKKARNVRANPAVTLVVDRRSLPYYAVMAHGSATIGPRLDQDLRLKMAVRYLGEEMGRRYVERRTDETGITIRFRPTRLVEYKGVAGRRDS
jgi:PPOX class probable F420-dependent enzyme